MQGFANLLQESTKDKLDKDSVEFIDYILDGTARMQQLIQSVLLHSNIVSRDETIEDIETDCNAIIEEVLENLDATIKDCHAKLEVDNLPIVAVERAQLIQLFQNIISMHSSTETKLPRKFLLLPRNLLMNGCFQYVTMVLESILSMPTKFLTCSPGFMARQNTRGRAWD